MLPTSSSTGPPIEPNLDSFVVRFVREGSAAPGGWHGIIRHVQSNRERAFTRWPDAVAFINEYVNVDEEQPSQ